MLQQYFQQHILDRSESPVSLVPRATKPGDSTKQLSRKASSAAAVDSPAVEPGSEPPRAAPAARSSGVCGCWRPKVAPITISPDLDIGSAVGAVAQRTVGFSGRELSKLVLKMQVRVCVQW